ncbi:cyclase family protein [Mesonia aestuariivivens]|uniref:Cyclase family protein n=1 Tax=Mesonia aestuariivivens TaxID=2796128 RepID=A0ABS6W3Y1_9FLAO|nr:cyclase family protein [Mesonia aestuariivivens]MBW2962566.1 cyclase family protein [Mesonia aestuariivivens]
MIAKIQLEKDEITVDLSQPLDISITLSGDENNPTAWYVDQPAIQPVKDGKWIAKVSEGASVNFNNIQFNPHAHGTHTESVGHISEKFYSVNKALKQFFFKAKVISLVPENYKKDFAISKKQLQHYLTKNEAEALVIRTLPNTKAKRHQKYSHTNWPYLLEEAAIYIRECGINHLLIDLPSVDKEKDNGELLAHRAFWNYPENTRLNATITELIYVSNKIEDGNYLINLQIASIKNDATPSKPVLYKIL